MVNAKSKTSGKAEIIKKSSTKANLGDYEKARNHFNIKNIEKEFEWLPDGKANIVHEAIDRHADSWRKNKVALYWRGSRDEDRRKYTFQELKILTNQFGNVLRMIGVKKGDRVFTFAPRIPELYIAILGAIKIGAIAGPLFEAFGPDAIKDRLQDSGAKVLVTTPELKKRVDMVKNELPDLQYIIVVGYPRKLGVRELNYELEMSQASEKLKVEPMNLNDPMIMHYTSGTTGKPKGVVHAHGAMIQHYLTTKWILDLRDEDVYWCTADPGWVTGSSYGLFGSWLNGASQVVYAGRFDPDEWYWIIDHYKVNVWYTAPTALRMLMKAEEIAKEYDLSSLRHICSVGEPLNREVVRWTMKVFGLPAHDTWWQTETGGIIIANYPCLPIKPGSMGKPFPGIEAGIIDDKGKELPLGKDGWLALRPGWPSMFKTIWRDEERYKGYFKIPGWYMSGDRARMDEDGYFWFVGRGDDMIKTAGHRIGPFEVESTLVEHPAVAEASVIGKPDPERGSIIKAFITLRKGYNPSEELKAEIQKFVRERLAAHAYPREIEFRETLPKTRSGKIMRRVLRAEELGLPTGDLSALEEE